MSKKPQNAGIKQNVGFDAELFGKLDRYMMLAGIRSKRDFVIQCVETIIALADAPPDQRRKPALLARMDAFREYERGEPMLFEGDRPPEPPKAAVEAAEKLAKDAEAIRSKGHK